MSDRKPLTLHRLRAMHAAGEKLAMLTCYDATFAAVLDEAGVDLLLVGDSLGMVLQGRDSTLAVTLQEMAYHTACVARAMRLDTLAASARTRGLRYFPAALVAFWRALRLVRLSN